MKLKKIASLALAGIMAVSMLAGCKDGGNSNSALPARIPIPLLATLLCWVKLCLIKSKIWIMWSLLIMRKTRLHWKMP